jgi:glycosyltransferase involved in cell wall biosynthesis
VSLATHGAVAPTAVDARTAPKVEIVIPVLNEETDLAPSVYRLYDYLENAFPFTYRITVADNGSDDGTWEIASALAAELPTVRATQLTERGRGRALRAVWETSDASVLAYMDVDLATDLAALLPLVAPLVSGHSDVAIGSRLIRGASVVRGPKRELISRTYNVILRATLSARFSDAQCGFKAIRADRAAVLLPLIEDTGWFFDTEMLVLAERAGLRIHEVPVDWVDDPDSRVDIVATALADLKGVVRLIRGFASGRIPIAAVRAQIASAARGPLPVSPSITVQVLRFAIVGTISTLAYIALYLAGRLVVPAETANAMALLLTAIANTAANRRYTFAVRGREHAARHQAQGLVVFLAALVSTSVALAGFKATAWHRSRIAELAVLVGVNLIVAVGRFLLLRGWVFRRRAEAPASVT